MVLAVLSSPLLQAGGPKDWALPDGPSMLGVITPPPSDGGAADLADLHATHNGARVPQTPLSGAAAPAAAAEKPTTAVATTTAAVEHRGAWPGSQAATHGPAEVPARSCKPGNWPTASC